MKRFICYTLCLLLCFLALSGCSLPDRQPMREQEGYAADAAQPGTTSENVAPAQSGQEPLSLDGEAKQTSDKNTVLYLTVDGKTDTYEYVGMHVSEQSCNVMFWLKDNRGKLLSSISFSIPAVVYEGDQYRYDDTTIAAEQCFIIYHNETTGKAYSAYNLKSQEDAAQYGFPTYLKRDGNQFVFAIDKVSADGKMIYGRLMAKFVGCDDDLYDEQAVQIDESSFVIDQTEQG